MTTLPQSISLGFAAEQFPPGVHICQVFSDDSEREDALVRFLQSGLEAGERTSCFTDRETPDSLRDKLAERGLSFERSTASGSLTFAPTAEIYFKDGRFDPDRMIELLTRYHEDGRAAGYPAMRVIGEMTPAVQHVPGGSRLLEYESRVSLLLRTHPVSCVCQYDARKFDGAMIMDVLKVHPLMVIRGAVMRNPFFVPPEEFLNR